MTRGRRRDHQETPVYQLEAVRGFTEREVVVLRPRPNMIIKRHDTHRMTHLQTCDGTSVSRPDVPRISTRPGGAGRTGSTPPPPPRCRRRTTATRPAGRATPTADASGSAPPPAGAAAGRARPGRSAATTGTGRTRTGTSPGRTRGHGGARS